jgi:hypothetical protein
MTNPELEKLSDIINELWQLHQETKNVVAQGKIKSARAALLILWNETNLPAAAS